MLTWMERNHEADNMRWRLKGWLIMMWQNPWECYQHTWWQLLSLDHQMPERQCANKKVINLCFDWNDWSILPTFDKLIRRSGHEKCRLGRFRSVLKCYSLWIRWVLKFLILWSDEINHSNFENATKCLNKSWWYLLKHACFILKLKDFCNTCVHFQWKKTNSSRHIGKLPALRMRGLHDKRQLLAKLRIAGSKNLRNVLLLENSVGICL